MIRACETIDEENTSARQIRLRHVTSGCLTRVMAEQASQPCLASDRAGITIVGVRRWAVSGAEWHVPQTLVRPECVVVDAVGLDDVVELAQAEAEEVVQTLPFAAADPGLGEAVSDGCHERRSDGAAVTALEVLIEGLAELGVAIVDQESDVDPLILGPHPGVASLLLHPSIVGTVRGGGEEHLSAVQMDEHQDVRGLPAQRRPHGLAEEVTGDHDVHMHGDELAPWCHDTFGCPTIRVREDVLVDEDAADRAAADLDRQLFHFTYDPAYAPAGILLGQAKDQLT